MCEANRNGGASCIELLDLSDQWERPACDECHREAEDRVIASADRFYDLAHTTCVSVGAWREVAKDLDKTVQVLRKSRASRRSVRN
jgi:hypothetical protein